MSWLQALGMEELSNNLGGSISKQGKVNIILEVITHQSF
jgi:hypothetical protein